MIAIARALLKDPSVLVLDEPTTYLDEAAKKALYEFIRDLSGVILIVISHDEELRELIPQSYRLKNNDRALQK